MASTVVLHLAGEMIFAVEVKGTLRARHVPRLTQVPKATCSK